MADDITPQPGQPTLTIPNATVATAETLGDTGKKALEDERTARKEADRKARALERELEQVRQQSMSDTEKAIAAAKAEGRTEGLTTAGKRLVKAEFRAAAATTGLDTGTVAELLDDLDLSRFLTSDGEPDEDAITKAVARFAALRGEVSTEPRRPSIDVDQGVRTTALPLNGDPLTRALEAKLGIR